GHEEFDGGEVVGIQGEGDFRAGHGNKEIAPSGGKRLENRFTKDVSMIAVAAVVSAGFAKSLLEHLASKFIEGFGTQIGVKCAGERGIGGTEFGKAGEEGRGSEHQETAVFCENMGGAGLVEILHERTTLITRGF